MKTDLTKKIECKLDDYKPAKIAGHNVNYFRHNYGMHEVPVSHSNIKAGLIDYVWLAELEFPICDYYECLVDSAAQHCFNVDEKFKTCNNRNILKNKVICNSNKYCNFRRHIYEKDYIRTVICFEIKVTKSDFNSNHGHNFVGNLNYYVVPNNLYNDIKDCVPDDIGVILFSDNENGGILRKKKDAKYKKIDEDLFCDFLLTFINKLDKDNKKRFFELKDRIYKLENELHFYALKYQDYYIQTNKAPKCFMANKSDIKSLQKYCESDGGINCGACPFNETFVHDIESML